MATPVQAVYSHITKSPDVCGGRACIDNTRIRVLDVAVLDRVGQSPRDIQEAYPKLSLAQIHAGLSYAYEHPDEMAAQLDDDVATMERIEQARAEFFRKSR